MRSITQNIILDRLQQALVARGVDLKRSAVLEVAAETFGFLDGNAFVAAMKEGRFDPPVAEHLGTVQHDGRDLSLLRDPLSSSVYALDMAAVPVATRKARFGVSPYGNLLMLPDASGSTPNAGVTAPSQDTRDIYVVDSAGNSTDPEVARWRHLLTDDDDIEVHCGPVHWADAYRMARIDGRLYFAVTAGEEYDNHEQGVLALRSFQAYLDQQRKAVSRVGGIIRCHDDTFFGRIELEVFLPADLASDVDDIKDWHEAISILLGADHEAVMATFGPQVWVKDDALDTDPEGETEFDVTLEILLMGSKAARAIEDYRDSSDDLRMAALADDWIRKWSGPFYVTVADEISAYLDDRVVEKEEDWSCDNCGETAQDGSGVCITCGVDSEEDEDEATSDEPTDAVCDDCEQHIDYDTGVCTGCSRDWSKVIDNGIDEGILRTVLPDDADHLKNQPDANDPA